MNEISARARISPLSDIEQSYLGSKVVICDEVVIDSFVKIKFAGGLGDIVIGESSYLNSGVVIYSGHGVRLGKGTLIASNVTIAATNHEYQSREKAILDQRFKPSKGGILIEDDCWVGANSVLLDGTILRKGCVVAAGSVVRGVWPEFAIIGGNPAKVLSYRL
jgi:virginiamycin A acetyltransferase